MNTATKVKLMKGHRDILTVLKKSNKPLTRAQILAKAPTVRSQITIMLGHADPQKRKTEDDKWPDKWKSLIGRGYVKQAMEDRDGSDIYVYSITNRGRAALT